MNEVHPEFKVRFDDARGEPRNADLVAQCTAGAGDFALSVEAKADEPFGQTVADQLHRAATLIAEEADSDLPGRVTLLIRSLFCERVPGTPKVGELRYQLLTAAAGAISYAGAVGASTAVLVFHEFYSAALRPTRLVENDEDLTRFLARLSGNSTLRLVPGMLLGPFNVPGVRRIPTDIPLYIGRVRRDIIQAPDTAAEPLTLFQR